MHLKPMGMGTGIKLGESEALLHKIVGQVNPTRVKDDLKTARQIVELCGCLPLAIRIAGATLKMALWQHQTLSVFRDELAKEETRLSKLESDKLERLHPGQGRVRPSFNLSYRALAREDQQLFRWISVLPSKDFGIALAAEVIGAEETLVNAGIARLIDAQVLEMFGGERFQFHDLMQLFAQEQLDSVERETALDRALNWYCKSANILRKGLKPQECPQLARIMAVGSQHSLERWEQRLPQLALDFFEAELGNWVTVIQQLDRRNSWNKAMVLASNLVPFFALRSHFGVWVATHEIAKVSSEKAEIRIGIAVTLGNLGLAYHDLGRWDDAISAYKESLQIHRELNDQHGIAVGLNRLANTYSELDKHQAINFFKKSLQIHHELGDEIGIAHVLCGLGIVYNSQGLLDEAVTAFEQSIQIISKLGDRHFYSQAKGNLGMVLRSQGKWEEAITAFEESLTIKLELRDRQGIAETCGNFGNLYSDQKKWREAITVYEKDLQISREISDLHGEGLSLVNIGTLYGDRLQTRQAKVYFQEALIKLDSRSDSFQNAKRNLRIASHILCFIRYMTGISISIFLLFCLLRGQYLFTIIGAFAANIIWWIIENKHSKNDTLLLRKLRGLVDE